MIVDIVYGLSHHNQTWCYISKENLAKELGLTSRTVFSKLNKLIDKGLLIKHPETKHLKTSELYYKLMKNKDKYKLKLIDYEKISYTMKEENISQDYEEFSQDTMKKFHTDYEKISYNNNNNKEIITNTINNKKNKQKVVPIEFQNAYNLYLRKNGLRDVETEFGFFSRKHSDYKEVLKYLETAVENQNRIYKQKETPEEFQIKFGNWLRNREFEAFKKYIPIKTQAQLEYEREQRYLEWESKQ
jgi:biotin operon repressor